MEKSTITINIEYGYASIYVPGQPGHYIELSGAYWNLHRSDAAAFSRPIKQWRFASRKSIESVIPDALAFVFRSATSEG